MMNMNKVIIINISPTNVQEKETQKRPSQMTKTLL